MEEFKYFISKYRGAIIGAIIGILLIIFKVYKLIISAILIAILAYAGNYIQNNKYGVKEKLKNFIDKW